MVSVEVQRCEAMARDIAIRWSLKLEHTPPGKLPDACYLKLVVDYADVRAQRIQHGGDRDQTVAFLYAKALAAAYVGISLGK